MFLKYFIIYILFYYGLIYLIYFYNLECFVFICMIKLNQSAYEND